MTKSNTKRALLSSVLAMILCLGLLIGTTFAWFTDSVTSSGNKIKAGTLDIQLLMDGDVDGTYDDISNNNSPIFGEGSIAQNNNAETLWEPGKTQVAYLAIKNNGNLALKYTVGLDVQNVSKNLYEVMEYAIVPDADANHKVTSWTSGNSVEVGTQSVSGDVSLPVGATHCFALVIHMDEEAGNEYQGGQVNFDLTVLATQTNSESDSFGSSYDMYAKYDVDIWDGKTVTAPVADADGVYHITSAADLVGMMNVTGNSIYKGKTIVLDNNIDLGGRTVKGIGGISTNFAGVFDGQGYTISNFKVDSTENSFYAGLFNQVSHGGTIKNLTVKNATIVGNSMVGAVASSLDDAVIDNCKAIDCTLIGVKKVGSVVGYTAGGTVKDCYAENCTVLYSEKEGGEILGYKYTGSTVSNNTAKNVSVKQGVAVSSADELTDAIASGAENIVLESGNYGVIDVTVNHNLTLSAAANADVKIAGIDGQSNNNSTNVTIKGVTIDNSLQTEGWYTGTAQKIKPCVGVWGGNYTFENCTFSVTGASGAETGVMSWWTTNKGVMNFTNCTFNGGNGSASGMQIYGNYDLNVTNCTFNTAKDYSIKYVGAEGCVATFKNNNVNATTNFVQTGSAPYAGANYKLVFEGNTLATGINHVYVDNAEGQTITINGVVKAATNGAIY